MKHKQLIVGLFVLVALTQLFLPFNMIRTQSADLQTGEEFKFKLRHNLPGSFNRMNTGSSLEGKYLWMQFEENKYRVADKDEWGFNQVVHVTFTTDSLGFARIQTVSKSRPEAGTNYIKARAFRNDKDSSLLVLQYPFNNYYIEDKDTRDIAKAINKTMNDTLSINYLVVKIKGDKYVSNDLVIDRLSFKEFVKKLRADKNK
jgi:hypothetical protein